MLVLEAPAESPAEGGSPDPPPLSLGEVQREGAVLLPPPPFPLASPERERDRLGGRGSSPAPCHVTESKPKVEKLVSLKQSQVFQRNTNNSERWITRLVRR